MSVVIERHHTRSVDVSTTSTIVLKNHYFSSWNVKNHPKNKYFEKIIRSSHMLENSFLIVGNDYSSVVHHANDTQTKRKASSNISDDHWKSSFFARKWGKLTPKQYFSKNYLPITHVWKQVLNRRKRQLWCRSLLKDITHAA